MVITSEIAVAGKPLWALKALMNLPFERNVEYPNDRLSEIRGTIVSYLKNVTYKQRNSTFRLGTTHFIHEMERVITVETPTNGTICLVIMLSDKQPEPGTCAICGCTEYNACYNPYYGSCWWINRSRTLCSHCAIMDIANSSDTVHPES